MTTNENLDKKLEKLGQAIGSDESMVEKIMSRIDTKSIASPSAVNTQNIWRIIIKSPITKLAAAAVIIIAAMIGINYFGGSIDVSSVAWAEVVRHIEQVNYVHFYDIETEKNGHSTIREGWYAHGKTRTRQYDAEQTIDNGDMWMLLDEHNNVIDKEESTLAEYDNIFDALTKDMLTYRFFQFNNKTPVSIGSDFLIYEFDPPRDEADKIEKISVTVGRNSLMPIQIKTYYKYEKWSMNRLLVFDYEAPEKPEEFFKLPTQAKHPHGIGRVVLGGKEVNIELQNAPGIKKAIVRLHAKSEDSTDGLPTWSLQNYKGVGEATAFTEITFVTDEDERSNTANGPLWFGQGVKGALGIEKTGSDNKYRYIVYTTVLRATDRENVFNLELSCWMKSKQLDS